MIVFVGRTAELDLMHDMYNSKRLEFLVLYGRRRIGKTELLQHFTQDKRAIYVAGLDGNAEQNLRELSRCILSFESGGKDAPATFNSMFDALEEVFRLSEKERIVLALDEYPFFARSEPSLPSMLQLLLDRYQKTSKLMLILCGSSISYMQDEVLAYKAPLYGRRTGQIKLGPLSFAEAAEFFPLYSSEEKLVAYAVWGGTPRYLLEVDPDLSPAENIQRTYLKAGSFLLEEPESMLRQELREPSRYNDILTAIAHGASKLNEIATKAGQESNAAATYLKTLLELDLVRKEKPYGEGDRSRRTIYSFADKMLRFWYRFIPGNISAIQQRQSVSVLDRILPLIPHFVSPVYEEVCRDFLWATLRSGEAPFAFRDLGRFWGPDPNTRSQMELDIMGDDGQDNALFAECMWTNEKVDAGVLEKLGEHSCSFSYRRKWLFLFSKSGFSRGCCELADKLGNTRLVTFPDMMNRLIPHS